MWLREVQRPSEPSELPHILMGARGRLGRPPVLGKVRGLGPGHFLPQWDCCDHSDWYL